MRVIGYFRLSDDAERSPSLSEQEQHFARFCKEQGFAPGATFTDADDRTAPRQTEYQRMLACIRRDGDDAAVVVESLNHLHNSAQELMNRLIELGAAGVTLLSMNEQIAPPLEAALQVWSTQRREDKKGEAVREAMKLRAVRGKGLGKPPYGYRLGADKRLEVIPEEAATVKLIYQLYLDKKMGVRLIARHLNEQGITTRRGGLWSIVGIRDILRNRAYVGTATRFGFRVPDSHRPIIDNDTFSRVQDRLTTKTSPRERGPRSSFLLSGLAYCGYCGNKMIGVNRSQTWTAVRKGGKRKGEYRYYQCQSRTNQSVCQYHTKRADDLERTVLDAMRSYADPEAVAELMRQHEARDYSLERAELLKRLKTLDRKIREHLDQAVEGAIPLEQLHLNGGDLVWEHRLLEERIELLDAEMQGKAASQERMEHVMRLLDELQNRWDSMTPAQRKALLAHLVDRVMVYDDHVETKLRL